MTSFPMISYRQFDQWLEQGRIAQIIDLREPWQYAVEHLWGSENIPGDRLEHCLDQIRRDGPVVFYCERGAKSMTVCRDLWNMGYQAVNLAGGMLYYRGRYRVGSDGAVLTGSYAE